MSEAVAPTLPRCALAATAGLPGLATVWMDEVYRSPAMRTVEPVLRAQHLTVEPTPLLYKSLADGLLRVIFPVSETEIEAGTIVSVVCLHDRRSEKTLYAHPMFAGPGVNPVLGHPDGPLAVPKAQGGADGDRATRRIMAHKQALWFRFERERETLGAAEAGQRWRDGYFWSLKRLYFCARCSPCRWGSPFFDGPNPAWSHLETVSPRRTTLAPLSAAVAGIVEAVTSSDAWRIEAEYARRGGFTLQARPRLVVRVSPDRVHALYPTDASAIQGGVLVGASFIYDELAREVVFAHCLCAGPEPEVQFMHGGRITGRSMPSDRDAARRAYVTWRRDAWHHFWLDELDAGQAVASRNWLRSFWEAMEHLLGGDDPACLLLAVGESVARRDADRIGGPD